MSYKSLYRKYRPSKFEEVYGQEFIIKTLKNAIENNKVSHAYLFTGTRGTGKTTIAKIFARMINCLDMQNNKICGKCIVCSNENTDEIQDIIEIDAASNNGVDEIRDLKNKIKLFPVLCKYKVYIIDEVHMLSTGAFNALLKTLEEPPEHVIFILATTDPQKLPITIISRCQRFDFKRISEKNILERLKYISEKEEIHITEEALYEISKICDGAMRDAIGILDQISSYSKELITVDDIYILKGTIPSDTLIKLCKSYISYDVNTILDIIEQMYLEGKNFYFILEDMLMIFRNIFIYKKAPKYFETKNLLLKDKIIEIAQTINIKNIENIIKKLEELSKNIKDSNYPRVLFELCLLSESNNCNEEDCLDIKHEKTDVIEPKKEIINIKEPEKNITIENKKFTNQKDVNVEDTKEIKTTIISKSINEKVQIGLQTKNKKILVNNTIALASAKNKKLIQDSFLNLDKYILEKKYKNAVTILKDATISAASEDHLLLTYKYQGMVDENDQELNNIKDILFDLLAINYKIVAITEEEWKKERPYYLNLKKTEGKIELLDETTEKDENKINKEEKQSITNIVDMFGNDLIEMEG